MTASFYWAFKGTISKLQLKDGVVGNDKTAVGYDTFHCFTNGALDTYNADFNLPAAYAPEFSNTTVMIPETNIGTSLFYGSISRDDPDENSSQPWLRFSYHINFDSLLVRRMFGKSDKTLHVSVECQMFSSYNEPTNFDGVQVVAFSIGGLLYKPIYSYISHQLDPYRPADYPYTHRFYGIFEIALSAVLKKLLGSLVIICRQSSDPSSYGLATACRITIFNRTIVTTMKYGTSDSVALAMSNPEATRDDLVETTDYDFLDDVGSSGSE